VADERFSGHLIFSTKKPGAAANELIEVLRLTSEGNVGIGTESPEGKLHVQTGGYTGWDRFVVNTTDAWGDGVQQVTIGAGGAHA
jgi:hypothetical protein